MSGICVCHNRDERMGQPLCFSFCCLFVGTNVCVCVCFWSYSTGCFMLVSPVSWRIRRVYVWVLCLDWVVIVFQTCGVSTAEWFTPTSMCCLPLGLINTTRLTHPELTRPDHTSRNTPTTGSTQPVLQITHIPTQADTFLLVRCLERIISLTLPVDRAFFTFSLDPWGVIFTNA